MFAHSKIFFSLVIDTNSFRKWLLGVERRGEEWGVGIYKVFWDPGAGAIVKQRKVSRKEGREKSRLEETGGGREQIGENR